METDIKSALLSFFVAHVLPLLASAVLLVGTWALAQLAKKLGADAQATKLQQMGAWAAHLASTVVADLEAVVVPALKEKAEDGVLTKAEVAHLRDLALGRLKALAGERGLGELQRVMGVLDLDKYLSGLLEKAVAGLGPSVKVEPSP